MIKRTSIAKKNFCDLYWENRLRKCGQKANKNIQVSTTFDLTDANQYIIDNENEFLPTLGKSIRDSYNQLVNQSDEEFKLLKPTKKEILAWRGISMPTKYFPQIRQSMFEHARNTKKGDVLVMPEYAYASGRKEYAESYTKNNGILYEITIPKGSRISCGKHYVFPRYSQFECTDIQEINDKKHYSLIKLTYKERNKSNSIFGRVKDFIHSHFNF